MVATPRCTWRPDTAMQKPSRCFSPSEPIWAYGIMTASPPLHTAAFFGDAEAIEALLAAGADTGARTNYGDTPLHGAAVGGHAEVIEALLAAGADTGARTNYGETPFDMIPESSPLVGTAVYWRLHDARWD